MRALLAASAALATAALPAVPALVPAAHADAEVISATCTATGAEFLLDHTGVAELHAYAVAGGDSPAVATTVTCSADWQYAADLTISGASAGPAVAAFGAGAAGGSVTVCVTASALGADGVLATTTPHCATGAAGTVVTATAGP